MTISIKTVCSLEEIKDIVQNLKLNIEELDNVEILLACTSGVCQTACEKGCQSCQPGNRYGPAKSSSADEDDEEDDEAIS